MTSHRIKFEWYTDYESRYFNRFPVNFSYTHDSLRHFHNIFNILVSLTLSLSLFHSLSISRDIHNWWFRCEFGQKWDREGQHYFKLNFLALFLGFSDKHFQAFQSPQFKKCWTDNNQWHFSLFSLFTPAWVVDIYVIIPSAFRAIETYVV